MASNIFSKLLPPAVGEPSVYETLQEHEESSGESDLGEMASMALDEENLGAGFKDYELNDAFIDTPKSHDIGPKSRESSGQGRGTPRNARSRAQGQQSSRKGNMDEADDDVPQSLLIENEQEDVSGVRAPPTRGLPPPIPGPSSRGIRAKWQATQEQQQLHRDPVFQRTKIGLPHHRSQGLGIMDPKEKAMWMWANVQNLDNFLKDVYGYFLGNGVWCIMLTRLLNLLTMAFVVAFSTFLTSCISFDKVPRSKKMSDILVPQCTRRMSGSANLLIWLFAFLWICKLFQYCYEFRRLRSMQSFYLNLLEISDTDIQTVSWQEIVRRLMLLRDSNPATAEGVTERHRRFMGTQSKQRMDAHDIANRLMRRDNYLIAMINKDVLDLTLPIPFLRDRQHLSKCLEWNLNLCILDYVFNEQGQVRPLFLKETHRRALSDGLRRRFLFAGFMNVLCAPFIVFFFMLFYFFRYFNEYQRNPSQIGSRQYTPLAEWKFREFNELWHLFERRLNMSYPFASRYLDQFPKDKTIQLARFIAFIFGALASVLAVATLIDPESFLAFEITPERTALFYLTTFGAIWAVARGMVPEENLVFDPQYALNNVAEYTHYTPDHWRDRLHSNEVRGEFAQLYKLKLVIFLEEIFSIIFTPFILWISLPNCSEKLVDFFREFTIHVDGLGYVCSFAEFNFDNRGSHATKPNHGTVQDLRGDHFADKDNKMMTSYYNFMDNYATSHRPGAPYLHHPSKQSFHAPPMYPGLMSPSLAPEVAGQVLNRYGRQDRSARSAGRSTYSNTPAGQNPAPHRTPRFAPKGAQDSPMASIILDPQHQPVTSAMRAQRRFGTQSRLRASRQPLDDPIEDEEEDADGNGGQSRNDGSGADDSNLGESWKTTQAATRDQDADEDAQASDHDRGVLGLVVQFSKQTEGRGAGVSI